MASLNYCVCSFCKSVNQTEDYKLKAANFKPIRVEIGSHANGGVPVFYNAVICKECEALGAANPIKPMLDVLETAKANDAEAIQKTL